MCVRVSHLNTATASASSTASFGPLTVSGSRAATHLYDNKFSATATGIVQRNLSIHNRTLSLAAAGILLPFAAQPRCLHYTRYIPRALPSAVTVSPASREDVLCIDLDSGLCDASSVIVECAWQAAKHLWPENVVGHSRLYLNKARPVLSVISNAYEAVVLIRLLADEGVIGDRSIAGQKAGPVVGRPLRHQRTTRPLLVVEITEHWASVLDSCLLRWGLEQGSSKAQLLESVKQLYANAQQRLLSQPAVGLEDCYKDVMTKAHKESISAPGSIDDAIIPSSECLADVVPYKTVIEAVKGSHARVHVVSGFSESITHSLLARCGCSGTDILVHCESGLIQGIQQALESRCYRNCLVLTGNITKLEAVADSDQLQFCTHMLQGSEVTEFASTTSQTTAVRSYHGTLPQAGNPAVSDSCHTDSSGSTGSANICTVVAGRDEESITASNSRLKQGSSTAVYNGSKHYASAYYDSSSSPTNAHPSNFDAGSNLTTVLQDKHASNTVPTSQTCSSEAGAQLALYLAEWSCSSMSIKARALGHPDMQVLAEHELAELLGVTHLTLVMDGVAWS